ncbi:MAG: aspartate aminotransferase [Planctomycetota bacterium]|jgi:aspartate aminotransferase
MPELNKVAQSIGESATMAAAGASTSHADPINLAVGEPGELPPQEILDAASDALQSGNVRYGPPPGLPSLRFAIADRLTIQSGVPWTDKNVVVTAGGKPALMDAMRCTLMPGDEVLVLAPFWPSFIQQLEWCGATPVICEPSSDLLPDIEEIRSKCTAKTKAIIVNSPSNPTSVVYSAELLGELAGIAEEFDLWIFADQVYVDLAFDGQAPTLIRVVPEIRDRTVVIESFSKSYSMTGMRLGYAAANQELIEGMTKLTEASSTHVNIPTQVAGVKALLMPESWLVEQRQRYKRRSQIVIDGFAEISGCEVKQPSAALYVFARIQDWLTRNGNISDLEFTNLLLKSAGVRLVPGSAFGSPGFIRIACGLADDRLVETMDRLKSFMAN